MTTENPNSTRNPVEYVEADISEADNRDISTTELHLRVDVTVAPWELLKNAIENLPFKETVIEKLITELWDIKNHIDYLLEFPDD